jgi:hypothetical protein
MHSRSAVTVCLPQEDPVIKMSWFADTPLAEFPLTNRGLVQSSDSVTNITTEAIPWPQGAPPNRVAAALPVESTIVF